MFYKNWDAIAEIRDYHLRLALSLLQTEKDEIGKLVAQRLPEYFQAVEAKGPVPLSALKRRAEELAFQKDSDATRESAHASLVFWGALEELGVPYFTFQTSEERAQETGQPLFPDELDKYWRLWEVGNVIDWNGKKMVIVQEFWGDEPAISPVECVAIDK